MPCAAALRRPFGRTGGPTRGRGPGEAYSRPRGRLRTGEISGLEFVHVRCRYTHILAEMFHPPGSHISNICSWSGGLRKDKEDW